MKVKVDRELCAGHALCNAQGGDEVYPLDAIGYNSLNGIVDIAAGHEDAARRGAAACPERAITIIE